MSPEIATALIGGGGTVAVALIGLAGRGFSKIIARLDDQRDEQVKQARVLERVRAQVENSHSTNLREENDQRHAETVRGIDRIADAVEETRKDIGGMRSEIRGLRDRDNQLDSRIQRIETNVIKIREEQP